MKGREPNLGSIDHALLICVLILSGFGLVMVFSSSSVSAMAHYQDKFYFARKQCIWAFLGTLVMMTFMLWDYRRLARWAVPAAVASVILLVLVFVPGLGVYVRGAWRWINFFGLFRINPAEVAKLASILFLADHFARHSRKAESFREHLLPCLVVMGVQAVLIVKQPDLSSAVLLLGTGFLLISMAHRRIAHLFAIAGLGLLVVLALVLAEPYRFRRLRSFLDPYEDPYGSGYHVIQSLVALGSGGWGGVGWGKSQQKFEYLPDRHTDFIMAIIGEELGLVGTASVVGLFVFLFWRGMRISIRAPDLLGSFLAFGLTTGLVMQALINVCVVIGSLPTTGVALPFISYGGSSLMLSFVAMGILLNVSRSSESGRPGRRRPLQRRRAS